MGKNKGAARGGEKVCEEMGKWRKSVQNIFLFFILFIYLFILFWSKDV